MSRVFTLSVIVIVSFAFCSFAYSLRSERTAREQFALHASIVADDVWALDPSGAKTYLALAQKAHYYQELQIAIPGDDHFVQLPDAELEGIASVFSTMGLISSEYITQEIYHGDRVIGTLQGRRYVRTIFPVLNILLIHIVILFLMIGAEYLFRRRKFLELQVAERTKNLQASEQRFHDLVNFLPEMVFETDLNGVIKYANKQVIDYFPSAKDYASHWINIFDLIDPKDREQAREDFYRVLDEGESGLCEYHAMGEVEGVFPILFRSAPIGGGDHITGARLIAIDITERHRMEEQLRRDQKMKAIGLMAGGVAHDLNNILSGIVSYPDLLLMGLKPDNPMVKPLKIIHRAGLDAKEVVSDLLTVARGVVAETDAHCPNDLVDEYMASADFLHLSARYPLIRFQTALADECRNISCSSIHVRKCLMNLVINAAEAIISNGEVEITTANHLATPKQVEQGGLSPSTEYTKICIRDTGGGISDDRIEHIFEPFYSKKVMGRSGTGLGLAVVWNTMRDHHGMVDVVSSTEGTTFELIFPSTRGTARRGEERNDVQDYQGNGETILVIDDEPTQRKIATGLLRSLGYVPYSVESGEEALRFLEKEAVDMLVLDMIMAPDQLNGRQTYEHVLKLHPLQKAIIASGYAEDDDVRETLALGASAFVAKPYTLEQIGSAIYNTMKA